MRKILLLSGVVLMLAACSTTKLTEVEKIQKKALMAQNVRKAIDGRYFTIEMDHIMPQRMSSRYLDRGYYVHVSGDSIYSYLPYVGRAWNVPYGGGKGLDFSGTLESYTEKRNAKSTDINMVFVNTEDRFRYMLSVYDDGKASLNVFSNKREPISFTGEMYFSWE